jgi:hypothetical protein
MDELSEIYAGKMIEERLYPQKTKPTAGVGFVELVWLYAFLA